MVFLFKNNCNSGFKRQGSTNQGSARQGSAILIVVLVMSVLSICCMTFWQNSHLFYDISLRRLEYEQKYRAAACGLDYAVSVCSKNFNTIIDSQDQFEIETGELKISENQKYTCKIYITKDGSKALNLKSVLFGVLGEKVLEVSCNLLQQEQAGQLENISLLSTDKSKNKKKFICELFTIKNWKVCD